MFQTNNEPPQDPNNPQSEGEARNPRQKPKKQRENFSLKPQLFQTKKGIRTLYERTKQLKLDDHSEINIENTMKKLVVLLKSWHFQMFPKYSFDYFIQRCQKLGSEKRIYAYMSKVRKIHKGLDIWQEIVPSQPQNQQNKTELKSQEQQQIYNGRMFEQTNQALKMMSNYAVQPTANRPQIPQEEDQEDVQQLMQMMYRVQKKQNELKRNDEGQSNQPYVPEGFQVQFQDQEYN